MGGGAQAPGFGGSRWKPLEQPSGKRGSRVWKWGVGGGGIGDLPRESLGPGCLPWARARAPVPLLSWQPCEVGLSSRQSYRRDVGLGV